MKTLAQYEKIAIKIINNAKQRYPKITLSDELLGRVIRYIAVADWKYNKKKAGKLTPYQFRQMRGIYAVREYLRELKEQYHHNYNDWSVVLDKRRITDNDTATRRADFLINNSQLTDVEKEVLMHRMSDHSFDQIAESLGMNPGQCREIYKRSIDKIRRLRC